MSRIADWHAKGSKTPPTELPDMAKQKAAFDRPPLPSITLTNCKGKPDDPTSPSGNGNADTGNKLKHVSTILLEQPTAPNSFDSYNQSSRKSKTMGQTTPVKKKDSADSSISKALPLKPPESNTQSQQNVSPPHDEPYNGPGAPIHLMDAAEKDFRGTLADKSSGKPVKMASEKNESGERKLKVNESFEPKAEHRKEIKDKTETKPVKTLLNEPCTASPGGFDTSCKKRSSHETNKSSPMSQELAKTQADLAFNSSDKTPFGQDRAHGSLKENKSILILGKTRSGKSSLGNLILGKAVFKVVENSQFTCTREVCEKEDASGGVILKVIDTPDITSDENRIQKERLQALAKENLDLILYVVRIDGSVQPLEQHTYYEALQKVFKDALTKNLVVVFNFTVMPDSARDFPEIPSLNKIIADAQQRTVKVVCINKDTAARQTFLKFTDATGVVDSILVKDAVLNMGEVRAPEATELQIQQPSVKDRDQRKQTREAKSAASKQAVSNSKLTTEVPCVLIIGKTGNGKSSLGNILLGEEHFKVGRGMSSTTLTAGSSLSKPGIYCLKVVDTPDVSGTPISHAARQEEFQRWRQLTSPAPHAVLLAVRCDVRYTPEEFQIYQQLKHMIGLNMTSRLIVAFTFGDRLDRPIETDLKLAGPELLDVLSDAENRHVVFNKKAKPEQMSTSLQELRTLMDRIGKPSQPESGTASPPPVRYTRLSH